MEKLFREFRLNLTGIWGSSLVRTFNVQFGDGLSTVDKELDSLKNFLDSLESKIAKCGCRAVNQVQLSN